LLGNNLHFKTKQNYGRTIINFGLPALLMLFILLRREKLVKNLKFAQESYSDKILGYLELSTFVCFYVVGL